MELQIFPDTPDQPKFGSAPLDRGQIEHTIIVHRFSLSAR
jgi:hypothetical protein